MSEHVHHWERENRQGQCGCGQCKLPDPRGLECADCPARLSPGDPGFDDLYEASPWWFDADDDLDVPSRADDVADVVDWLTLIPIIQVPRGGIRFPTS